MTPSSLRKIISKKKDKKVTGIVQDTLDEAVTPYVKQQPVDEAPEPSSGADCGDPSQTPIRSSLRASSSIRPDIPGVTFDTASDGLEIVRTRGGGRQDDTNELPKTGVLGHVPLVEVGVTHGKAPPLASAARKPEDSDDGNESDDRSSHLNSVRGAHDEDSLSASSHVKKKKKGVFSALKVPKAFKGGQKHKKREGDLSNTPKPISPNAEFGDDLDLAEKQSPTSAGHFSDRSEHSEVNLQQRIQELCQQSHNLESERETLQLIIESKNVTIATLKGEVEDLEARISVLVPGSGSPKAAAKLEELSVKIQELQAQIAQEHSRRVASEAELADVKAELVRTQAEYRDLRDSKQTDENREGAALREQISLLKQQLERKNADQQESSRAAAQEVEMLKERLALLEDEKTTARDESMTLKTELAALKSLDGSNDGAFRSELDKLAQAHNLERRNWETALKKAEETRVAFAAECKDRAETHEGTITQLETDLRVVKAELRESADKARTLQSTLEKAKQEVENAHLTRLKSEATVSCVGVEREKLEKKLEEAQGAITALKEEVNEASRSLHEKVREIAKLKSDSEVESMKKGVLENNCKKLQDQLKAATEKHADLTRMVKDKEAALQQHLLENARQRAQAEQERLNEASAEEEIKRLRQKETSLKEEIQELRFQFDQKLRSAMNDARQPNRMMEMSKKAAGSTDSRILSETRPTGPTEVTTEVRPKAPPEVTIFSNVVAHSTELLNFVRTPAPVGTYEVVVCLKARLVEAIFELSAADKSVNGHVIGGLFRDLFSKNDVPQSLKEAEGRPEVMRVLTRVRNLWQLSEDLRLALVQGDPSLAPLFQRTKTRNLDWESTLEMLRGSAQIIEERNSELERLAGELSFALKEAKSMAKLDREKAKSVVSSLKKKLHVTEQHRVASEAEKDALIDEIHKLQQQLRSSLTDNDRLQTSPPLNRLNNNGNPPRPIYPPPATFGTPPLTNAFRHL